MASGWITVVLSMIAAYGVASAFSPFLPMQGPLVYRAAAWIQWSLGTCAAAGLIAFLTARICVVRQWPGVRSAVVAAFWMAPMVMLTVARSSWALVVAMIIGYFATEAAYLMSTHGSEDRKSTLAGAFVIAVILEGAVLLWSLRIRGLAVLSLGLIAAALTLRFWAADPLRRPRPAGWDQFGKRLVSVAFTIFTLLLPPVQMLMGVGRIGPVASAAASRGAAQSSHPIYPGIIIVPEIQRRYSVTLVPPLPSMKANPFATRQMNPMSIPFFGVYWLLRPPQPEPSPTAATIRGDPSTTTYRSTDGRPLSMTARQSLGKTFDLRCCSEIRVVVLNGERNPGSITVELRVRDSVGGKPAISLGEQPLLAHRNYQDAEDPTPVPETLKYRVNSAAARAKFDELLVVFHLGSPRGHRSARVAVDRFTLVPRGGV